MKKPEIIEVVRYIRPDVYDSFPLCLHDNLHGITVIFTVDYAARTVKAQWSVCNQDNFDRKVGKDIARQAKEYIYPLDVNTSLSVSLLHNLLKDQEKEEQCIRTDDIHEYAYEFIRQTFLNATRKMKAE